ncbi:hypothetical protein VIGAN_01528300 [Vigna angularis var. angularis]|uniref:Uncharacterized protein n=1 Tax=Vigna angularis var. angularis TaxID=157739 RepID=A0A0S3R962_PHAAN|nr:hypothetical protein VIGAN_01528300 [Vigna angularis var. angularis]
MILKKHYKLKQKKRQVLYEEEMNSSVEIIEDSGDSEEKDVLFTVSIGMSRDKEDDAESCNCDTTYSSSQEEEEAVGALEDDGEKKDIW